ncbi:MAG: hypothetical protein JRJ20_15480 [Deltaproteobacteria bacterium]|nr:hypothetical protein [Deltaproteobacteria bacterium]
MKAGIIFTGTGPILILTSFDSFEDPKFVAKLRIKGIEKFIACELPVEKVKAKYGNHFQVVMGDLNQTDDLRVLDYNGHNVFYSFSFSDMGRVIYHEGETVEKVVFLERKVA